MIHEPIGTLPDASHSATSPPLSTTTTAAASNPRRAVWLRVVAAIALLLTGWHLFASFLWVSPPSVIRQVVPGESTLHNYMIPLYGQSWSVFAPAPINGDYRLRVRAEIPDKNAENGATTTEWVDSTAVELSMLRHNLFPPRAALFAEELASGLKNAWGELSEPQRAVVELGFYKGDDWRDRLAAGVNGADAAPEAVAAAETYLAEERKVTAYATQVAHAVWGPKVTHVQFEVSRQNIVPFAERHNPKAERPARQFAPMGWRGVLVEPGQNEQMFADTFLRAMNKTKEAGE